MSPGRVNTANGKELPQTRQVGWSNYFDGWSPVIVVVAVERVSPSVDCESINVPGNHLFVVQEPVAVGLSKSTSP